MLLPYDKRCICYFNSIRVTQLIKFISRWEIRPIIAKGCNLFAKNSVYVKWLCNAKLYKIVTLELKPTTILITMSIIIIIILLLKIIIILYIGRCSQDYFLRKIFILIIFIKRHQPSVPILFPIVHLSILIPLQVRQRLTFTWSGQYSTETRDRPSPTVTEDRDDPWCNICTSTSGGEQKHGRLDIRRTGCWLLSHRLKLTVHGLLLFTVWSRAIF